MARGTELFRARVRSVLSERCLGCHGGEKKRGDFDLSTREALLRGGVEGPSVVPGSAAKSRLLRLISHAEKPHMPHRAEKLSESAIRDIAAWIDLGAPYDWPLVERTAPVPVKRVVGEEDRRFWSFRPLAAVEPPAVKDAAWCRTPIDRFVLAKLEEKGIAPNPAADRRRLIRRASFDLLGLPPTPEEVEAFVADPAPDAYEKLIDRLLESPRHGERWGRHWLDLARFAESHGFEHDYDRPSAYHYRDFVIRALNEDMPYDRFVRLQLAGDELEPQDPQALMATGFLAAGVHSTQITANLVEKERYDEMDDMASTVGTAMLGITIGCARCHDHKYDPVPTEDYYRLLSTFTTTVRSELDLDLEPERTRAEHARWEAEGKPLRAALERFDREELPARREAWLAGSPRPPEPRWIALDGLELASKGGAAFRRIEDGSFLASGANAKHDLYTFTARTPLRGIAAVRIEALADPSLPKGGPGRAGNGNFDLTDLKLTAAPLDGSQPATAMKLSAPRATFEQKGLPAAAIIDADPRSGWAVDPQFGKDHAVVFDLETPIDLPGGAVLVFTLEFRGNDGHNIGRPRVSISTGPLPAPLDGEMALHDLVVPARKALSISAEARTGADREALARWHRLLDPERRKLAAAVEEHARREPKPKLTKVLVSSEGLPAVRLHTQGADFFEKTYFLKRGDPNQKDGEAAQGFLQVLMRKPGEEARWQEPPPAGWRTSYRRKALASWITDADQGAGALLARVMVNRLWQHHLGRGIVSTPSDFGAQGERPTHPELLDWLAGELVRGGWKLKRLHKLILQSAVYRQDSAVDPVREAADPENRLFWRRPRMRLEAEALRDTLLFVSGKLETAMYGPGTLDEGMRRRSIYFTMKRSQLIPGLALFDAPDGLQGLAQRSSTTIAPQALHLMNNAHVQSWARAFARRILETGGAGAGEAVERGYRIALGRDPTAEEREDCAKFIEGQEASYRQAGKAEARELALSDFCLTLMGLNELIYVE